MVPAGSHRRTREAEAEAARRSPPSRCSLALGAGGCYGHYWWTAGRYLVTTDDAYVGAKNATLPPKVSGYVADVHGRGQRAGHAPAT